MSSNGITDMSNQLQNLANELDTISAGITSDFEKVGNNQCVLTLADAKNDILEDKKILS